MLGIIGESLESSSHWVSWSGDRRRRPLWRGAAGYTAARRGTGVLAVPGAADDVAVLVDRSATAARLEAGDGGIPGSGHAVHEPRANPADELACRADQRVAVPAVAPGQAARGTRPGAPRARSRRRAVYPCHLDRGGLPDPRRSSPQARGARAVAPHRRPLPRAAAPHGPRRRPHHVPHRHLGNQLAAPSTADRLPVNAVAVTIR